MTENEFLLVDRIAKIKSTIEKWGEDYFYISFSGGKDSTVLSALVDMAVPNNKIPRVYSDTGIELKMIRDFVLNMASKDERITVMKPHTPLKQMLDRDGYPFKSKLHSTYVRRYRIGGGDKKSVQAYINGLWGYGKGCPKALRYQFTPEYDGNISAKCCENLKKKPLNEYEKETGRKRITGMMADEHGLREMGAGCQAFKGDKLYAFNPLMAVTKEWEQWFIDEYDIEICAIYGEPYNFERTGCKGCPYNIHLQRELDTLEKYFPNERKQCELIWKPVYDEYRRIGYRLKPLEENHQMSIEEWLGA